MATPRDQDMRREALRLAVDRAEKDPGLDVLKTAESYFAFMKGDLNDRPE